MPRRNDRALIVAANRDVHLGRLRMLACVLEGAGYQIRVVGSAEPLADQPAKVGGISIDSSLVARRGPRRLIARPKRLEATLGPLLEHFMPQLVLAMDPLALYVARAAVLQARDIGIHADLGYDRTRRPAPGSGDDWWEAAAISDVRCGIAASRDLARDDRWPESLHGEVPTIHPVPLELVAGASACLPSRPPGQEVGQLGIFLPPGLTAGQATSLWDLLKRLAGSRPVVLGAPRQLRSVRRRSTFVGVEVSTMPLPDEDDIPELVGSFEVVICPSSLSPGLPPSMVAAASGRCRTGLVASRRVIDELGIAGHGIAAESPGAIAAAVQHVRTGRAKPSSPTRVNNRDQAIYGRQLESLRQQVGTEVKPKLGIGPRNGNGQGWAWAQALRNRRPEVSVEVFAAEYTSARIVMTPQTDVSISMADWKRRTWQLWWAHRLRAQFTHLLIEQGLTACGLLNGGHFFHDLPLLLRAGVRVGLVFRGSEIRDPAAHAQRERWSPFKDPTDPLTARLQARCAVPRQKLANSDVPKFVTTLDLLDDVPDATWLPHGVDLEEWLPGPPILTRRRPVVLHAPSSAMKGSHWVDEACGALHDAGVIEYARLREVPFVEMPARIRAADVVIDQLALGSYGLLAVQAMASERLVIGHISDGARARLDHEIPVLQAEPPNLRQVIEEAVAARDWSRSYARAGREYVSRYHSGDESADRLLRYLVDQ